MGVRVLVMGASGRLGAMLRRHWRSFPALAPIWQFRDGAGGADALAWSPLQGPVPSRLGGKVDVVLCLSGAVPGPGARLDLNTDLALAACKAARDLGARHVFVASSAAVYGLGDTPHCEAEIATPLSEYGLAKLAMERAALAQGAGRVTCLRIGNVAGADALLGQAAARGPENPVLIDRFPGGHGPLRSYIGPQGLARWLGVLCDLAATRADKGAPMPEVLNLAAPGVVDMAELVGATGQPWAWRVAPAGAIARVELDIRRLAALCPPGPLACSAAELVREWQLEQAVGHT